MGLPKLWGNAPDGSGHGFVYSHVKSIYYNWAQKKLLSTKLDEIDTSILDLDTEKFDISKIIASTNITQTGYVMDGKTCSDAIAQLNSKFVYSTDDLNESINIPKDGCYLVMVRGLSENGSTYLGILRNGGYIANSHKAVTEAMTLFTFYIGRLSADDVLTVFRENIQDAQNVHFCFAVMWLRD